jgi:dTDP-4-amino-4,6-dideoxygalactose transaminase
MQHLKAQGIGTEIYYPLPLHLQKCFAYLNYREGSLPASEAIAKDCLSLPVYPELTADMQQYVVSRIVDFYRS